MNAYVLRFSQKNLEIEDAAEILEFASDRAAIDYADERVSSIVIGDPDTKYLTVHVFVVLDEGEERYVHATLAPSKLYADAHSTLPTTP